MITVTTSIPLPIAECRFRAKRSKTERPSGLAFILLKMIGEPLDVRMTFSEFMDELGLPEDVFSLFETELRDLIQREMVEGRMSNADLGSHAISDFRLTKHGKEAFQSGVISVEPLEMRGEIFYTPAENNKMHSVNTRNTEDTEPGTDYFNFKPDSDYLEDFLKKHKEKYSVDSGEDVFDFNLEKMEYFSYKIRMVMEYNDATASFSIPSERAVDPNFIKNNFSSEFVLDRIEKPVYDLNDSIPNPKKWEKKEPDWTEYSYILPSEFIVNPENFLLADKKNVDMAEAGNLPKSLFRTLYDFDVVEITSHDSGHAFSFILKDVSVDGLEGTVEKNMVIRRSLSKEEILGFVESALSDLKKDKNSLEKSLRLCKQLSYGDKIQQIIKNAFVSKKIPEFADIGKIIRDILKNDYSKYVSWAIEEELLKSDMASGREDAVKALSDLSEIGIKIESTELLNKIFAGVGKDDILKLADSAILAGQNKMDVLRLPDVGTVLAGRINSEVPIEGNSEPFIDAENTRYNLYRLKNLTGVKSTRNYSLDLDLISDEDSNEILKSFKTFSGKYRSVSPYIAGIVDLAELKDFINLFSEINIGLRSLKDPLLSKNDLLKSNNMRMVGLSLGITLEEAFRSLNLGTEDLFSGIEELYNSELVDEHEYSTLQDIREFRNRCAHDMVLLELDNNTKKKWVNLVFKIKQMPLEGKKKEGKK